MRKKLKLMAAVVLLAASAGKVSADTAEAACEVYAGGETQDRVQLSCTFSQRQGYITISRADGVTHELSPSSDTPGNFTDQHGKTVYRQSGLGDQGLIFAFPDESVYVWWNAAKFEPKDENNWAAPFTSDEYDATARLRCKASGDSEFGSCPAGILRMEDRQASIVVQNQLGEQFTINFMSDYINATNRELQARMDGDTWILEFANGEVWEVPVAAIEGG